MTTCIVYMLYSGLTFATVGCQSQTHYGNGVITPHKVVYTSHIDECYQGWGYYVDRHRVRLKSRTHHDDCRHTHHHNAHRDDCHYSLGGHHVHRKYRQRVKYYHKRKHHHVRRPALRKRATTRHYNKEGQLRKRVVRRHYKNHYKNGLRKRVITRHYNKRGKLRKRVVKRHYRKK